MRSETRKRPEAVLRALFLLVLGILSRSGDPAALFHRYDLVGRNPTHVIHLSAGPANFNVGLNRFFSQAERQHQFARGKITRSRSHALYSFATPGVECYGGSNTIAVRFCAAQLNAQRMICSPIVSV